MDVLNMLFGILAFSVLALIGAAWLAVWMLEKPRKRGGKDK